MTDCESSWAMNSMSNIYFISFYFILMKYVYNFCFVLDAIFYLFFSFTKSIVSAIGQRPKTIFVSAFLKRPGAIRSERLLLLSMTKSDRKTMEFHSCSIIIYYYLALNWDFIWTRLTFHLVLDKNGNIYAECIVEWTGRKKKNKTVSTHSYKYLCIKITHSNKNFNQRILNRLYRFSHEQWTRDSKTNFTWVRLSPLLWKKDNKYFILTATSSSTTISKYHIHTCNGHRVHSNVFNLPIAQWLKMWIIFS